MLSGKVTPEYTSIFTAPTLKTNQNNASKLDF